MSQYEKGQIICITSGVYDGYRSEGHYEVLKDIIPSDFREKWLAGKTDYNWDFEDFIKYLIDQGYLKEIGFVDEFHLGNYETERDFL